MAVPVFSYQGELLHQAAIFDQRDFLKSLLQSGVQGDANCPDPRGLTPVHTAALHDSNQCLEELLSEWKGNPNSVTGDLDNYSTPIHLAAKNGHIKCLRLLVENGGDVSLKNKHGKVAREVSLMEGHYECAEYLKNVEAMQRAAREEELSQELFSACATGEFEKVQVLIDEVSHTNINRLFQGGYSLLYKAASGGHLEIVKLLLSRGSDGAPQPFNGMSPLYVACSQEHVDVARLLTQAMPHQVNIATTMEKQIPLHVAASIGNVAIVKILMQCPVEGSTPQRCNGIDINARTSSGMTPLHHAVPGGCLDVVKVLIEGRHQCMKPCRAKAVLDINAQSIMGRTALHDAITVGHKEVVKLLLNGGADANLSYNPDQVLYRDDPNDEISRVARRLAEDVRDKDKTPLGIACDHGDLEIVEILLKAGAVDFDSVCVEKAAKAHHHALVHLLLSKGVNVDCECKIPHSSRSGNHMDEAWRIESNPVCIIWNGMKLTSVHPQWIVDGAKRINPQVAQGNVGLHPVLKTITRLDLSGNALSKLPLIIFQLPSLKVLNISENSLSVLPSLHNGRVKSAGANGTSSIATKKFHSCDNITDRIIEEEEKCDFTYAESSWNCPHLEELELHHNSLTSLPTCIFELPMLRFLNASFNDIDSLPFGMWFAPVLKTLDLKGNYLKMLPLSKVVKKKTPKAIPKTFNKPRHMSKSRDDISKELIPEQENGTTDAKLPSTTKAEDKKRFTSSKAENSTQPTKPLHLKIYCHSKLWGKNGLEEMEDSSDEEEEVDIHKGHALLKLDLSNNQFHDIPKGLACLATNLQTLNLSNNYISKIETLGYFPSSLSSLDISSNRLSSLNPQTIELPTNSCYALAGGQRTGFGMSRSRGSMRGRVCRHLRHRTLSNLKRLDVNQNSIREITFITLQGQSSPVKTSNETKSTAWFAGIDSKSNAVLYPSIQSLNLSGNPLTELPKDIGVLNKLGSLHISHTDITKLPAEIGLLSDLWDLQYQGLTLHDIEPSVLERKKTKDLVSYLRSILERSKPYPCMKLMFVGVSNIGKTTLLNQLRQEGSGSYQTSPSTSWTERQKRRRRDSSLGRTKKLDKNISTVGVDVSDWTYPRKNEFFRGDARPSIKFSTWDFGGQREYYATHQCFLSHRSLYIVMWKVTDGEKGVNEIEPWLLNIQARAPDSPCIIVGTHYDMMTSEEKRAVLPDLQQMIKDRYIAREFGGDIQSPRDRGLPRVMSRIEISSKTGYHVRDLRHMIYSKAIEIKERGSRTPLLETPIPESYIQVEEVVGKIRKDCYQEDQTPVMRAEHFRNAVQKELDKQGRRLRDLEELQQATKFLHDNGILLHYDDPLLRDLYFLDPQWLCDMLAHVVTVRQVNPHINNGVMKLTDLSLIFRSENFPANLIKQYINLLSKFEVALQWSSEYLLVPSLLPDRQPISNQPIAPGVSPVVTRAMNMAAYTKTRVLRRQYVMSYVPSGFWPRLITRIISDEEVRDVVRCCCQLVMEGEAVEGDKEKLASVAQPDWSCWKTGVELSCFGVKMLRICDLEGYPFYGAPEDMFNPLQYRNEKHDPTSYSTIAVIAPCVNILMEKFVQKKKISKRRNTRSSLRHGDDDDDIPESKQVLGFRVKSVSDAGIQLAARVLAIVVEHIDTLITDWFPGLDALTVHGYRLVSRIVPCPKCITELSGVEEADQDGESVVGIPYTPQNDSGAHLTTDGSSASASPWPSPVHGGIRQDIRGDTTPSPVSLKKSNSQGSTTSELTIDTTGELPMSPPFIQVPDNSNRFTFKSVSSGLGTNDSSSYFEDTSDHSSDSGDEPKTDGSEEPCSPQKGKGKLFKKDQFGSSESDRSRGSEEFNRRGSRASNSSSERPFGSQTDSQKSRGSTESTSSFNRSGRYGSFRRRPNENEKVIYAFEFEECVLCAYNGEPIKCEEHGQLNLRELAPDVMFEDIAPHLSIHSGNLVRGKFLGKGTFGSVFRGDLKGAAGDSEAIAMKMPLNNEVGEDAKPEERQAAEAAKRALRDNPTMALNEAYRTVRQEISILLPLQQPNIVSLKGFCLSPLCMVLEFAPLGALDRLLHNYKRGGARLNPYVVQKCIVQCSSALKYLHKHHIIYRDLKSENILAWSFPEPHSSDQATHEVLIKLADYGISRTAALAGIKGLGGTPGFMAPEIEKYVGKECYTDKVDTFSFGMYIYELITLHQPFCDLSPAQVKQMIVDGQRPPLSPKDRKGPVFAMDLMAWCWEQDSDKRPTSAQVYALASSLEFARLADVLTFDKQLTINCAVTAGSRVNSGCGADGRPSVGNEVWLCRSELNDGLGTSKINVVKYSGGRFSHKEELSVNKASVRVATSVGSTVWLGTETGTLHVYCSITYRELCRGIIKRAKYILNMVHIPRCNWVLVALADGSILAYNDNICNHYHYTDPGSSTPTQELLPSRGYPGNGNPIHCIASVPIIYPRIVDPSSDDGTRGSPEPTEEYICEVWCGQEKGEITVLDGEELQKISTMPAEDSDSDVTILREQSVSHLVTCRTFRSTIKSEEPVAKSVWVALFPGTRVFRWDAQEKRTVRSVDCSLYKPRFDVAKSGKSSLQRTGGIRQGQLSAVRAQVNSLLAVDKELYIGTSWGCILVCNNISLTVLSIIRCHEETVNYLLPLVSTSVGSHSNTHNSLVMSCGRGYRNIGSSLHGNNPYPSLSPSRRGGKPLGKRESAILVWLADSWDG